MAQATATTSLNVGFLTIVRDGGSYAGGYLVLNTWGRPVEFRVSSAVQPNRVHQVLYAGTLEPYICADLIAKTLVEKTATQPQLVVTDDELVLELRLKVAFPVAYLGVVSGPQDPKTEVRPAVDGKLPLVCHPHYAETDLPAIRELLVQAGAGLDLSEPFQRIRDAMNEARRAGVSKAA